MVRCFFYRQGGPTKVATKSILLSFPQSRKLSGVGNPSEKAGKIPGKPE